MKSYKLDHSFSTLIEHYHSLELDVTSKILENNRNYFAIWLHNHRHIKYFSLSKIKIFLDLKIDTSRLKFENDTIAEFPNETIRFLFTITDRKISRAMMPMMHVGAKKAEYF